MTKFIGIISAKGGVGKTTTAINLSSALFFFRRNVIVLDANFANPDVGTHLGVPISDKNLHSALEGEHDIKQSIYKHPSGLRIIPGSISYYHARNAKRENLLDLIYGLVGTAEVVIIDSTPGMGRDARTVIRACDKLIVVTTPDLVSVSGTLKTIRLAREESRDVLGVVVNKQRFEDYELSDKNISEFLDLPVLAVIPDDIRISRTLHTKSPHVITDPNTPASIQFKKMAGALIGEKYVESLPERKEEKFIDVFLRNIGFKKFK